MKRCACARPCTCPDEVFYPEVLPRGAYVEDRTNFQDSQLIRQIATTLLDVTAIDVLTGVWMREFAKPPSGWTRAGREASVVRSSENLKQVMTNLHAAQGLYIGQKVQAVQGLGAILTQVGTIELNVAAAPIRKEMHLLQLASALRDQILLSEGKHLLRENAQAILHGGTPHTTQASGPSRFEAMDEVSVTARKATIRGMSLMHADTINDPIEAYAALVAYHHHKATKGDNARVRALTFDDVRSMVEAGMPSDADREQFVAQLKAVRDEDAREKAASSAAASFTNNFTRGPKK